MGFDFDSFSAVAAAAASAAAAGSGLIAVLSKVFRDRSTKQQAELQLDDLDKAVAERIKQIYEEDGARTPAPTPGEVEAQAIMDTYSRELVAEARRIAKRANAERPSKKHMRLAADRIGILRDRAGVLSDLSLSIGSILIGGAVSFQVNLGTGGEPNEALVPWIIGGLATGVGFVVSAATTKWRRA